MPCDNSATDFARTAFRLEHRDTDREVSHSEASHKSAHHHVDPRVHCGDLNDIADNEDEDTKGQTLSSAPPIGGTIDVSILALL